MKSKAVWITCILAALFFCGRPANAAVIMTLENVGSNVVAMGSGTVDLAGLTSFGGASSFPSVAPSSAILLEGNGGDFDIYTSISGPTSFGSGGETFASSGTGDLLGIYYGGAIAVPTGYVSGTPLSSTATWNGTNLATLGVTPGTYTWTWGSGPDADSLTLYAGVPAPPSVPEPAPALLLTLGAAALALFTRIKK